MKVVEGWGKWWLLKNVQRMPSGGPSSKVSLFPNGESVSFNSLRAESTKFYLAWLGLCQCIFALVLFCRITTFNHNAVGGKRVSLRTYQKIPYGTIYNIDTLSFLTCMGITNVYMWCVDSGKLRVVLLLKSHTWQVNLADQSGDHRWEECFFASQTIK